MRILYFFEKMVDIPGWTILKQIFVYSRWSILTQKLFFCHFWMKKKDFFAWILNKTLLNKKNQLFLKKFLGFVFFWIFWKLFCTKIAAICENFQKNKKIWNPNKTLHKKWNGSIKTRINKPIFKNMLFKESTNENGF